MYPPVAELTGTTLLKTVAPFGDVTAMLTSWFAPGFGTTVPETVTELADEEYDALTST